MIALPELPRHPAPFCHFTDAEKRVITEYGDARAAYARRQALEELSNKLQIEIDYAHLNGLRLPPTFGKIEGEVAVRTTSLEALQDYILGTIKELQ